MNTPQYAVKTVSTRIGRLVRSGLIVFASVSVFLAGFFVGTVPCAAENGRVESIALSGMRGIFRFPPNNESDNGPHGASVDEIRAARKVKIDYCGETLDEPAWLTLEYTPETSQPRKSPQQSPQRLRIALDPEEHGSRAEVFLPCDETLCDCPMSVRAVLEFQDRKIDSGAVRLEKERKWEIHLIHQTHLDIGYTHTQEDVLARQVQSLRDALKYIEETKDYPEEAKFRFHPEGMWAVEEFFKVATEEEKTAFVKAAKNRDIHLDVMYAQAMTGLYSEEELFELMGAALRFGRRHGITIDSAMQTDVPGYAWGLVPVLARCGVKYMTMGPNCGHRVGRLYHWGEKPFYWESPSGRERVLCYLADSGYHQFHSKPLGHRLSEEEVFRFLDGWDPIPRSDTPRAFSRDLVPLRYGIEGDNGRPNRVLSDVVKQWNETYLHPRLVISRNSGFMREFEKRYGDEIPVVRGDYTPYWEDGAASTTEATGMNRRAKQRLLWAEIGWAIRKPQEYFERIGEFDAAWTDLMMYDEHTWGAHNSISEPDSDFVTRQDAYKQAYARRGFENTTKLLHEVREVLEPPGGTKGVVHVDAENGVLDNGLVSLKIDPRTGAISSLKLKGIGNDLVKPGDDGNSGLNDYLYIIGRDAGENRERCEQGVKITAEREDTYATLKIESAAPNCETLIRTITLRPESDVVRITNMLEKKMERRPEGTFFGFPFHVPGGTWRVDTPWATIRVEEDQLPGANRNYYCAQRFCNISNGDYGIDWVTIDVPMVQFAPILFTDAWNKDLSQWRRRIEPGGTVYSWVCNNHWETNYKAGQDGTLWVTYLIRPYKGKFDIAESQRFARALNDFSPGEKLLNCDNRNVLLSRLKPARTEKAEPGAPSPYGQGLIVRLFNPTDAPQKTALSFAAPQMRREEYRPALYLSNPLEDRLERLAEPVITVPPRDFVTLRAE